MSLRYCLTAKVKKKKRNDPTLRKSAVLKGGGGVYNVVGCDRSERTRSIIDSTKISYVNGIGRTGNRCHIHDGNPV